MNSGGQQYGKADNTIYSNNIQGRSAQMTPIVSPQQSFHASGAGYNMPQGGQPMMGYGGSPQQVAYGVSPQYGAPQQQMGYGAPQQQMGYGSPQQQMGYGSPQQQMGYGIAGMMPPGYNGMQNQGVQGAPFQGAGYGNLAAILNSVPYGLYVKQKPDYLEHLTGCDRQNKYKVYPADGSGDKGKQEILYCKETSEYCDRACASPECRGISMDIRRVDTEEVVLRLNRECQCTFCCCNRPEMKVYLTENGQNTYLGKVMDPYDCCNHGFKVYDQSDNLSFSVEAECCQCGLYCGGCPCETCEKVVFNVWRGDKEIQEKPLMKLGTGDYFKNALTNADNFSLPFPSNSTWQEKSLLLALVIMIDYLMFEQSQDGGRNNHRHHGYDSF